MDYLEIGFNPCFDGSVARGACPLALCDYIAVFQSLF